MTLYRSLGVRENVAPSTPSCYGICFPEGTPQTVKDAVIGAINGLSETFDLPIKEC